MYLDFLQSRLKNNISILLYLTPALSKGEGDMGIICFIFLNFLQHSLSLFLQHSLPPSPLERAGVRLLHYPKSKIQQQHLIIDSYEMTKAAYQIKDSLRRK